MTAQHAAIALPVPDQYRVLARHEDHFTRVVVAEALILPSSCPHCHSENLGAWGSRDQVFKDLPHTGKHVEIHISNKRMVCKRCDKTFSQSLPGMSERRMMTERLARWIGDQGLERTFISIADDIGVVEGTIRNVFADFVDQMEQMVRIGTPKWMVLLDVRVLNKLRTLVINTQTNTVIDILEGRNKLTMSKYMGRLKNPQDVQLVGMGFSTICRDAVQGFLPGAAVFIDKPYVLALVDTGMVSVRAELRARLSSTEQRGLSTLWPLLMVRHEDWPSLSVREQAAVKSAWERDPSLHRVSLFRESIYALYDGHAVQAEEVSLYGEVIQSSCDIATLVPEASLAEALPASPATSKSKQAEECFSAAMNGLEAGEQKHFAALAQVLFEWRGPILNYFKYEGTRASISNLGDLSEIDQQIERAGRSYVFEALRCKMLFPNSIPEKHYSSPGMALALLRKN